MMIMFYLSIDWGALLLR